MKQQLGHYDLVAELGRGGMGVVYKGYEASLHRYVAIKVLADSLAHDPAIKERFLREARSMAALNDPHIIQIYFIGDDEGQTFFVMEFVDGESLSSVLKREHQLKPEQAAKVIYQTALGLATAHDRGVIHRDIKPGNIMIDSRGNVKIADFGIALSSADISKKLTSTGEFVGTPGYLSPEVCLGKLVDQRSDIFSLGIVLFEMLAGRMPFTDESPLGLMLEVVKAEIPDVRALNADVDPELSRILSRMIAKEPADRYQSCQDLAADLARHPLLANGATLQLRTQPSPAAATLIGMKTPAPGQSAQPNTTPTPRPLPNATSAPTAVITPPRAQTTLPAVATPNGAHQSLLERQAAAAQKKSGSAALPLAIAALLLLGLAGGAFAYRDQLGFMRQFLPASLFGSAPATTTEATTMSASAATKTASGSIAPASATVAPSSAPAVPPPAPVATTVAEPAAAVVASATATNGENAAKDASATNSTTAGAVGGASLTELTAGGNAASASASTANASAPSSTPAPVDSGASSPIEPPKPLAAPTATQIAKAMPPPPAVPPRPHVPTVAVLSGGDITVSEPAGRVIEQALARRGYRLADSDMMPGAGRYLSGQRVNVPALLDMLAKGGRVDAVVIVHARPTGQQNLPAYGMNVDATTAQLNVMTYAVSGRRKLGAGWTQNVIYTGLSAKQQGEEAVEEITPQVESLLVEYRPGHRHD
ncbi:MAG: protein kinase [Proteobacteria bacterium]|uniref:serine/threonine-protein kinase n=1 Tax=Rudaea sp. TaxID=2136325 RepID=UPI0037852821|nr:protein kinase [Pseudomonadota bacterium]